MSTTPWLDLLHRLNLNHLVGFLAVAEAGSFRAAAARLHMSQSALSVQVRQLEQRLGVALFHRTTRSVALTDEGRRLDAVARRIGADLGQVAAELKEEAQLQRGTVTVAALPSLATSWMPRAMRAFQLRHPQVELRLRDADSLRAVDLLRQSEVDLAVLSQHGQMHGMAFTPLFHDPYLAVVPASGHALSRRRQIGLTELARYPLLLNPRGVDSREILEQAFVAAGLQVQPAQELVGTPVLLSLVLSGFGVAVLPRMAMADAPPEPYRILPLHESPQRTVGILTAARRALSPAALAFRAFLQEQTEKA
jgi:LysR family carnitine catabolism transcriptional activator